MREWWRGGVIYQVYPRSFQDSNGDGIGDLPGIIRRLDHIASLGVDCIWLSPITQSPQADMGYDVSDYREVDRLFGSLHDFDSLVEQAHARGLKVIMDQVVSHTSDLHPWFRRIAASTAPMPRPIGMSGPIRCPMAPRPITGPRSSAAAPGSGTRRAGNITCTISSPASPTSTSTIPKCSRRCSMSCASGWSVASMASASIPSITISTTRSCARTRPTRSRTSICPMR